MDLKKCYLLEDLFPKSFADYERKVLWHAFIILLIRILMILTMR